MAASCPSLGLHCSSVLCLLSTERRVLCRCPAGWLFWVPSAVGVNTDAEEKPLVVGALAACKGILAALESSSVGSLALFLMVFL